MFAGHLSIPLGIIENPRDLLLMWIISINIYHIRNLKNFLVYLKITIINPVEFGHK